MRHQGASVAGSHLGVMKCDLCGSRTTEQTVTDTIQLDEKVIVVAHVPACVCISCGERLYSPDMGERLQKTVWEEPSPS